MDKTVLKNFAIYARNKLIQDIKNKASMIGITEKGIQTPLPESTSDMLVFDIKAVETYKIYDSEVQQYWKLIDELKKREANEDYKAAYTTLIEEVAYTWFNRMIAIRFMEVNNYLPDKMRVLSSGREGVNEPEFVTHYEDTSLHFNDKEREQLASWKIDGSATAMENMFQLLFVKQCNALHENLPELFEKTNDYAELLLTISYNDPNGVLYKLVHDIPEEYFNIESEDDNGQVEIIGWMYQYYNTERKDEVFSRPKSAKIQKEDIPAATQLFTPDWIVRYMVENSLGRLWIEKLIASGDIRSEKDIAEEFNWKYYIPEAEQNEEVKRNLIEIRNDRKNIQLEDIKFIDPAMGSFHIGVYAFEVFMQLYESQGYTAREAAVSVIENNLYGLDIDKRAYQLSYFACMMKGRQYNRRILNGETKCNLYAIPESNNINRKHLDYLGNNISDKKAWGKAKEEIDEILDIFIDAKEYGSILNVPNYDFSVLNKFIKGVRSKEQELQLSDETIGIERTQDDVLEILSVAKILAQNYDVVVTNPPYMGSSGMNPKLSKYVKDNYPDSKSDLFAVFIEKCLQMTKANSYTAMITQHAFMFLSSYEKLRFKILLNDFVNMAHLGARAFEEISGEVVQTTSFVSRKSNIKNYKATYARIVDYKGQEEKENAFLAKNDLYMAEKENFAKIPGLPVIYDVSDKFFYAYDEGDLLGSFSTVSEGIKTGNNNKFLRLWFEVDETKFSKGKAGFGYKWYPHHKGGEYRKWFGNRDWIINWENDGKEIKNATNSGLQGKTMYFKEFASWSKISSKGNPLRFFEENFLFDSGAPAICNNNILITLALFNCNVGRYYLIKINPTLNLQVGDVKAVPLIIRKKDEIEILVKECISICRSDWDSFETSWDFKVSPLVNFNRHMEYYYNNLQEVGIITEMKSIYIANLEHAYEHYKEFNNLQFDKIKSNEEELNRIFIEIYRLEEELTSEVSDKDITITKIFDTKDEIYDDIKGNQYILTKEDVVKSFISYAVGCMFGRYSLDIEGLAYAGGEWDDSKYSTFIPAEDNIILISDEEYFEDDIVNRFVDFVRAAYGKDTLEENLKFIADALGGNGTPKEVIRNYFIKDFYKDHLKTYQKRPIYWQYDSGKQNGFKALIYMHRYNEDTTGKLRIDYLHEMQKAYERAIDNLQYDMENNNNPREVAKLEKRLTKLTKQLKECKDYDEKIAHLALARIPIDLDDGVKVNYDKIQTDEKGKKLEILTKIR